MAEARSRVGAQARWRYYGATSHRANRSCGNLPGEAGKIYKPVTDEEFEKVKDKPFAELTGALVFISRTGQPWITVYVLELRPQELKV